MWGYRKYRRDLVSGTFSTCRCRSQIAGRSNHGPPHSYRAFTDCLHGALSAESSTFNPAAGLRYAGGISARERVLTDEELVAVWHGAEKLGWPYGTVMQLLLLTGARREEIGQLRWAEIIDGEIRLDGARTKMRSHIRSHYRPLRWRCSNNHHGLLVAILFSPSAAREPHKDWARAKASRRVCAYCPLAYSRSSPDSRHRSAEARREFASDRGRSWAYLGIARRHCRHLPAARLW